jgi:CheY-like chemotaxis protein
MTIHLTTERFGPPACWLGLDAGDTGSSSRTSSTADARQTEASVRILLVEDEPDVRYATKVVLEDHGYRVTCAENGWEALELLRSGSIPDVIVLDLRMPIMDGWEFRALQKRNPELAEIPVVAVSADGSARAAAIDAQAHLRKPLNPDLLLETIDGLLAEGVEKAVSEGIEELRRTSALGRYAAGLGYEINRPLVQLMIAVDVVGQDLERIAEGSESGSVTVPRKALDHLREILRDCHTEFDRMRQLLRSLQRLSRPLEPPAPPLPTADDRRTEGASETRPRVLVIDDEPITGATIRTTLAGELEVVAVSLASEAFARLAAGETFDLVFCDLFMPEMSGREIYERLVSDWPRIAQRVVFLSDAAFVSEASDFVNRTSRHVLLKPFKPDELRAVVEAQIEDRLKQLN